jgi:hypothetical protein
LDRRLGGPQSHSGHGDEEKNCQSLLGIEPHNPDHPARSPTLYQLKENWGKILGNDRALGKNLRISRTLCNRLRYTMGVWKKDNSSVTGKRLSNSNAFCEKRTTSTSLNQKQASINFLIALTGKLLQAFCFVFRRCELVTTVSL